MALGRLSVLDIGLAHPVRQTEGRNSEVLRDLDDLLAGLLVARDAHDVPAEPFGVRLGRGTSFPAAPLSVTDEMSPPCAAVQVRRHRGMRPKT